MADNKKDMARIIVGGLSSPKTGPDYNQDDATDNDGTHTAMEEFIKAVHSQDAPGAHEALKNWTVMHTASENEDESAADEGSEDNDESDEY